MTILECEVVEDSIPPGKSAELMIKTQDQTYMLPVGVLGLVPRKDAKELNMLLIKPRKTPVDWCREIEVLPIRRILPYLIPQTKE